MAKDKYATVPAGRAKKEKKPYRLNMSMSYWAHRKLRVMAAEGMTSMAQTIEAAMLAFETLDDDEREPFYDEARALRKAERLEASGGQEEIEGILDDE